MPNPNALTELVVCGFACWRLTHLIVYEEGPGEILAKFRKLVSRTKLGRAVDCFLCASVWIGGLIGLVSYEGFLRWVIFGVSVSGIACIVERLYERPFDVEIDRVPTGIQEDGDGMLR